jgi:uncharacterized glyoxalase superfamily protein PhnB
VESRCDAVKVIGWLCDVFGFTERLRAAGKDGKITHAQLSFREGAVMLGSAGGQFGPPRQDEVNQYVVVHVEDVTAHFEHAQKLGARIVQPLTEMPFGERMYTAEESSDYYRTEIDASSWSGCTIGQASVLGNYVGMAY